MTRIALALGVAATACAPVPLGDGERLIAVRDLGTEVIVPQLFEAAVETDPLSQAMVRVTVVRTEPFLDGARAAWRAARRTYKLSEAFGFGPAADLALDEPVDAAGIEAELLGPQKLDAAYIEELPGPRKGFHALEVMLFGVDGAVLASFDGSQRRRDYLIAVAQNLAARVRDLRDEWSDAHAERLATPAADDPSYPTIDRVMRVVAGECAELASRLAELREESELSDNTGADLANALRGLRNVYYGTRSGEPGKGLGGLVAASEPEVDRAARAALEAALAAVAAIPRPFHAAVAAGAPEVGAAQAAVAELHRILATDVARALGLDENTP